MPSKAVSTIRMALVGSVRRSTGAGCDAGAAVAERRDSKREVYRTDEGRIVAVTDRDGLRSMTLSFRAGKRIRLRIKLRQREPLAGEVDATLPLFDVVVSDPARGPGA